MQAGGFGGSRQGVVEANALKDINRGLSGSLANLYGNDYQQAMGRNLQKYQGDQSYDLGLRGNDLGFAGLDFNINQGNINNQLAGANLGMNTFNAQQQGNQNAITAGTNMQNTPYNNWSNFNAAANNVGQGLSSNTSSQNLQSSPVMNALGGWQLGTQLAGQYLNKPTQPAQSNLGLGDYMGFGGF
jgi:hypothetical protein